MSTSAHERPCWQSKCAARDIANSLFQKWAIKGFFPESPCRVLSLVLSFASKESTAPLGVAAQPSAPESARQTLIGKRGLAPAGAPKGFPRGKQSARFALPCAPLVVCLNSGSLTAFGGCIHWIPASLRSPLETFGSPTEAIERPIGLQALLPRRSRRTPARGSAPAHSRISFLRSQNSAPERKGNAHALFCRW